MPRTFKIILTFVLGLVSFLFFLILSFPLESVFSHFLSNLEERTQGQYRVSVESMDPSLIFSSHFQGVVIEKKASKGFEPFFKANKLEVNISFISLISKTIDLSFVAAFAGGEISGEIKADGQKNQIDLNLDQVQLAKLNFMQNLIKGQKFSADLAGAVNGNLFVSFSSPNIKDVEAEFNLELQNVQMNNVSILRDALDPASEIKFDLVELSPKDNPVLLQGSFVNNQLRIHDFAMPGPDLEMQMKGKINLKQEKTEVSFTRLDLKGRFVFAEKLSLGLPELNLLSLQKGTDGYFPFTVSGRSDGPNITIGTMDITPFLKL